MELAEVKRIIENAPKGANIVLEWIRPCKVYKNVTDSVAKAVRMVGRIGLTYDNLSAVQTKRENGELPKENQGLPFWAEWEIFPFIIKHKTTGQRYLRLYKGTSEKVHPSVRFLLNGEETTVEAVRPMLLASELAEKDGSDCFMVGIENLTRVWSDTTDYGNLHT